jgi:hypothetical protein
MRDLLPEGVQVMKGTLFGFLVAVVFWGGAVVISPHASARRHEREELMYYPSGAFLKEAVLGYDQAAASVMWLRTVQYYGEHVRGDQEFDMLYHMCDVTTDLDPRFEEPYVFGSLVLLTEGKRPTAGMRLLEKGREENPGSWKVFFETGFAYYIAWENYPEAARYFARAAAMPDAPERASRFAAWATYRAGDLKLSLALWADLAERTRNPELRKRAVKKVEELSARLAEGEGKGGS